MTGQMIFPYPKFTLQEKLRSCCNISPSADSIDYPFRANHDRGIWIIRRLDAGKTLRAEERSIDRRSGHPD